MLPDVTTAAQLFLAFDSDEAKKARGAFFTPGELAGYLATWAVRTARDRILEPSCGEASLLAAAGQRLRALGAARPKLVGLDVHQPSVDAAEEFLRAQALKAALRVADFFDEKPDAAFDVVIGNPPYIRYQAFSGKDRAKAQRAALAQGVRLSGLANAWAAFVVHASSFLNKHGRLALVLPAVLLSVNYAAPVRRFLLSRFKSVRLVMFEERVFPGVLEEVMLLLAEGQGSTSHFDLFQVRDLEALSTLLGPSAPSRAWTPTDVDDKWTEALLPADAGRIYAELTSGSSFETLSAWGDTGLGMVTGNNRFFTLTAAEVASMGLPASERVRISPPGSRHLRGLSFSDRTFAEMAAEGSRVYLFYPDKDAPSDAAKRHIERGEQSGVHKAYKCAVRAPWWRVPYVPPPDFFFTYMNNDAPRLVRNQAGATYLNSVHGVNLKGGRRELGLDLLPIAMLNSLTLLGAELVGRSYGGGILKLEPNEADRLPMPSPRALEAALPALRANRPHLSKHLRTSHLAEVVQAVDAALLVGALRVNARDVAALVEARKRMSSRRSCRSGKLL
jgi:adenine-specific DNA methylase